MKIFKKIGPYLLLNDLLFSCAIIDELTEFKSRKISTQPLM